MDNFGDRTQGLFIAEKNTSFPIPYYDGLRIPSLERVDGTPDRLDEILAPSKRPLPAM